MIPYQKKNEKYIRVFYKMDSTYVNLHYKPDAVSGSFFERCGMQWPFQHIMGDPPVPNVTIGGLPGIGNLDFNGSFVYGEPGSLPSILLTAEMNDPTDEQIQHIRDNIPNGYTFTGLCPDLPEDESQRDISFVFDELEIDLA
jgi:hypothetical protein